MSFRQKNKFLNNIKLVDIWSTTFYKYITELYDFSQNYYMNDQDIKWLASSGIKWAEWLYLHGWTVNIQYVNNLDWWDTSVDKTPDINSCNLSRRERGEQMPVSCLLMTTFIYTKVCVLQHPTNKYNAIYAKNDLFIEIDFYQEACFIRKVLLQEGGCF